MGPQGLINLYILINYCNMYRYKLARAIKDHLTGTRIECNALRSDNFLPHPEPN